MEDWLPPLGLGIPHGTIFQEGNMRQGNAPLMVNIKSMDCVGRKAMT